MRNAFSSQYFSHSAGQFFNYCKNSMSRSVNICGNNSIIRGKLLTLHIRFRLSGTATAYNMKFKNITYLRWPLALITLLFVVACASMGRPEGGPIDETPPVFVKSRPAPGQLNVKTDRIIIEFDENIQIEDPLNKVVVSPAQKNPPKVTGVGHRVTVELQDSLRPNTTYTIDFTDAVADLNEKNTLDGFSFDFSTGPEIDSLCISGMVFQAENLEPAQAMLVGVHSNLSDTAITKLPFDRITRTNQYGQFTLRNLKPGEYNVFAINDINRDNKWDRSEDIAFLGRTVSPTAERVTRTDSLKAADGVTDSLVVHEVTTFAPNDLLLTWFNENYKPQYITKNERRERRKIYFEMGAPSDTLPSLKFVGGDYDGEDFTLRTVLEASATRDTLTYWIADTVVANLDSIALATTFLRTDTAGNLKWTTDTLNFNFRAPKAKKKKKEKDNSEAADTAANALPKIDLLKVKANLGGQAEVYSRLILDTDEPLRSFDRNAIHLEMQEGKDTIWQSVTPPDLQVPGPYSPRTLQASYDWIPGARYRLTIDSLAMTGIYDHHNGNETIEFSIRPLNEYGNISFTLTNLPEGPAFVQLLNAQDAPVYTKEVSGGVADFRNVTPGTYYARLIADRNGNGKWDTGSLTDTVLQPEDVYYFPKKINLKKNWDINQPWNLYETAVDLQKPMEIKKNKPKKKKGEEDDYGEEDDQYYDEFGNPAVDPDDPFGKRKNRNYNRTNRNTTGRNGLGSFGGGAQTVNSGIMRR